LKSRIPIRFNAEQHRAISHRGSPLRIIAGAGTGKTATLTGRFVDLVEQGDATIPEILALTFTRKAATEMKDRIIEQLDRSYTEFWVETFHSFCARILRVERGARGLPPPRIIDGQSRIQYLHSAIAGHEFPSYGARVDELHRQTLVFIDRAKDELLTPTEALALARSIGNQQMLDLATAYDLYQHRMREDDRYFDWGELQTGLITLLEEDGEVLERWRRKFRYILVDEYQDINHAQNRLVHLLARDGHNLTVVGDVDQSIYAFRGASHSILADMVDEYPNTETIHLSTNFRSHQPILDVGNALIGFNPDPYQRERLRSHDRETGPTPTLLEARDEDEESDAIARQIARLHLIDSVPLNQIAVLLRSVHASGEPIERALTSYGLRSNLSADSESLGEAARDVLAVLRLIDSRVGGDVIRVLLCQGIDAVDILSSRLESGANGLELVESLSAAGDHIAPIIERTLGRIGELKARTLPEQVYQSAVICGRLPLGEAISRDDYRYIQSLRMLLDRSIEIAESGGGRESFIAEISAGQPALAYSEVFDGPAVQIMTVHAAKGLEFDHVFVAGMAHDRFPLRRRLDRGLDLNQPESLRPGSEFTLTGDAERKRRFVEEERRLGYVALTRARENLYLSYARSYSGSGSAPSVFIADIASASDALMERIALVAPDEGSWSASELARAQYETIERALDSTALDAGALSDMLLAQWTLSELPGSNLWRAPADPEPYLGHESLRLSYSALNTYDTCARRYYYAHVLGLPDSRSSPYMLRGSAIHDAVQWLNERRRDGPLPTLMALNERFESSWNPAGYDSPAQEQQFYRQCREILSRFHSYEEQQEREILDVEVKLDTPLGRHTLAGRIDCVARRPDGTIEIVDYKSGKTPPGGAQQKLQLGIYQIAYAHLNPDAAPEAVVCTLGHKDDRPGRMVADFDESKQIRRLGHDQGTIDEVTDTILGLAERILHNDFQTTNNPWTCRECGYRHVCEGVNEDG
jgi:DNA helicase II / ATP-dependent DNA helicase PcrA